MSRKLSFDSTMGTLPAGVSMEPETNG